jgi:repressor of nif and glnA expression
MIDRIERKRLSILRLLAENGGPLSSRVITDRMNAMGQDMSERTVRFHLLAMDRSGFTEYIGKKGRRITDQGRQELSRARVVEKVGFLTSRIDQLTYEMTFDRRSLEGTVVVNLSYVRRENALEACRLMKEVYAAGYSMGTLAGLLTPNEQVGQLPVPEGHIGLVTVCSITLNGLLLAEGIPVTSRFGGLLELEGRIPTRFVAIINYDGTSLDPLEIFIKSGMTDYTGAVAGGYGLIGASFRDIPAAGRSAVESLARELVPVGLGGFMELGWPGQPLYGVPVNEGIIGAVVIGGLNPVARAEEAGIEVESRALSGLMEYQHLFHYSELEDRARELI